MGSKELFFTLWALYNNAIRILYTLWQVYSLCVYVYVICMICTLECTEFAQGCVHLQRGKRTCYLCCNQASKLRMQTKIGNVMSANAAQVHKVKSLHACIPYVPTRMCILPCNEMAPIALFCCLLLPCLSFATYSRTIFDASLLICTSLV